MAREYAPIRLSIWSDDDFRALSPRAQHLYFVLLTSPTLSYAGVADWRPGRIAANAEGWTPEAVRAAAGELVAGLYVVLDDVAEEALIRSFVKHDGLMKNPKTAVSMAMAFASTASKTLRGVIVHELLKLRTNEPELKGWDSPKVREVLTRNAIDPAGLPLDYPQGLGVDYPVDLGVGLPQGLPVDQPVGFAEPQGVGLGEGSLPAPAPAPTPAPYGGSPTEVTHLANETPNPIPPKKFHDEHNDGWVVGCEECEHLEGEYMAILAAAVELRRPAGTCSLHPDGTTEACGPCGDARRARKQWEDQRVRWQAEQRSLARQSAAEARAAEIANCGMCDVDGYRGTTVCDHVARQPRKSLRAMVAEMKAEGAEPGLDPAQDEPGPNPPPLRSVS